MGKNLDKFGEICTICFAVVLSITILIGFGLILFGIFVEFKGIELLEALEPIFWYIYAKNPYLVSGLLILLVCAIIMRVAVATEEAIRFA